MDNFFVFIVRSLFLFRFFFSPVVVVVVVVVLLLCSTPRVENVLCVRYCVEVPLAVCIQMRHGTSEAGTKHSCREQYCTRANEKALVSE